MRETYGVASAPPSSSGLRKVVTPFTYSSLPLILGTVAPTELLIGCQIEMVDIFDADLTLASGSTTLLEIPESPLNAGFQFQNPGYFLGIGVCTISASASPSQGAGTAILLIAT